MSVYSRHALKRTEIMYSKVSYHEKPGYAVVLYMVFLRMRRDRVSRRGVSRSAALDGSKLKSRVGCRIRVGYCPYVARVGVHAKLQPVQSCTMLQWCGMIDDSRGLRKAHPCTN